MRAGGDEGGLSHVIADAARCARVARLRPAARSLVSSDDGTGARRTRHAYASAGKPLAEARKRRAAIERPSVGSNAKSACTATIVSGAHEQNNL